jgi:mRNA-degrading endonuclease RelE of RelBE toxin-antitoxin system
VAQVIEAVEAVDGPLDIGELKKLAGGENAYRIRIGDYRIALTIDGDCVDFMRFLNRRDLYRFFP